MQKTEGKTWRNSRFSDVVVLSVEVTVASVVFFDSGIGVGWLETT
jgi:hypothetical protein